MMCAEALWWRCHRRLIADRLVVMGDTVCHIGSDGGASPHQLTAFAAVDSAGGIDVSAGANASVDVNRTPVVPYPVTVTRCSTVSMRESSSR